MKHLAILGSTGSIGKNALRIAAAFPERFSVTALAAGGNVDLLAEQVRRFDPEVAVVQDESSAEALRKRTSGSRSIVIFHGPEGYQAAAALDSVDLVVSAMAGAAGLLPTLAAVEHGKTVALANKESLVMAGALVMDTARRKGAGIIPIDSEHSAIFQCLSGNRRKDLKQILLTASGGPLLNTPEQALKDITPETALRHPNWDMGPKVTIDSATLMNKGLEVIEATWLFDVTLDMIRVVIHPESIVHSMVVFFDGSVMAQLGEPDMRIPIAYALSYPKRLPLELSAPDFTMLGALTFRDPDLKKFPCLALALEACRAGQTYPAVLNAADEVAVHAFLNHRLSLARISEVVEETMNKHEPVSDPGLSDILAVDGWARQTAEDLL
ncbi:MAG: 1-deoxy-D-xylulose-5-phosphate reductoisomerase [Deltaproteobacteria bacterium]|nr:1-deoxy-D-xylulose-5-phosphate reductoisomerase [Deltaproteobacteria bacterium]